MAGSSDFQVSSLTHIPLFAGEEVKDFKGQVPLASLSSSLFSHPWIRPS